MRFEILRKVDKGTEAGVLPGQKLLVAMGNYLEEAVEAGTLLAAEGLQPSSKDVRVEFSRGKPTGGDVELEIRQVFEAKDCGTELTPELKEADDHIRARITGQEEGQ